MKTNKILNLKVSDWIKIAKGAGIASTGAVLTYVIQELGKVDFGSSQLLMGVVISVLTNIARKYFSK